MRLLPVRLKKSGNNNTDVGPTEANPKFGNELKQESDVVENSSLVLTISINRAQNLVNSKKKSCNPVCVFD